MPKSRHATTKKKAKATLPQRDCPEASRVPPFAVSGEGTPLLTLLFDSKQAQHEALSRIEAFYESTRDCQKYLTLQEAKDARVCQHYEAYNFPLCAVSQWLRLMQEANDEDTSGQTILTHSGNETVDHGAGDSLWWERNCNGNEIHLLKLLESLDVLSADSFEHKQPSAPIYLISTLSSKQDALYHEKLHYLYYISPIYRLKVEQEYASLSSRALKVISQDLTMRKYSPQVWPDEFQAYISEDAGEFGQSIQLECQDIKLHLNKVQRELWKDIGPPATIQLKNIAAACAIPS